MYILIKYCDRDAFYICVVEVVAMCLVCNKMCDLGESILGLSNGYTSFCFIVNKESVA